MNELFIYFYICLFVSSIFASFFFIISTFVFSRFPRLILLRVWVLVLSSLAVLRPLSRALYGRPVHFTLFRCAHLWIFIICFHSIYSIRIREFESLTLFSRRASCTQCNFLHCVWIGHDTRARTEKRTEKESNTKKRLRAIIIILVAIR